jgi:RNA polymerase sigma factor (sigma-70 family)
MEEAVFERLVASHRGELFAHCYRMLGSVQDAEDALQESLLGAWRGLAGFEGRSSPRAWLYRITTNACLRLIARRPRRMLSADLGPPRRDTGDLGMPVTGPVWLEPLPDELPASQSDEGDPAASYLRREGVELAFVGAMQHLPGTQRAVLILREVLGFSAAEAVRILATTPAAVNGARCSAPGRRSTSGCRQPRSRPSWTPWARTAGASWWTPSWPPGSGPTCRPSWSCWRRTPGSPRRRCRRGSSAARTSELSPNGCSPPGGGCCRSGRTGSWPSPATRATLAAAGSGSGAINLLRLRAGRIVQIAGFLDPGVHRQFRLPDELPEGVDRRSDR